MSEQVREIKELYNKVYEVDDIEILEKYLEQIDILEKKLIGKNCIVNKKNF